MWRRSERKLEYSFKRCLLICLGWSVIKYIVTVMKGRLYSKIKGEVVVKDFDKILESFYYF